MRVAFRADGGGAGIGIGHLMRCIAIAEALRSQEVHCWFVCKDYPAGVQLVREHGYEVRTLPHQIPEEEDLRLSRALMHDADLIVVDSHAVTPDYLNNVSIGSQRLVCVDDKLDRDLPVDLVIGNAYATRMSYGPFITDNTILLSGPKYLPLRREFQRLTHRPLADRIQRVLITFGGEDPINATQYIVQHLANYSRSLQLDILLGIAYPYQEQLEDELAASPHAYNIHRNVRNVLALYQDVDVAIAPASVTMWELAAAGTPMVILQTADNQSGGLQFARKQELGVVLGELHPQNPQEVCFALAFLEDKQQRIAFSQHGQTMVDGRGAERIADALIHMIEKGSEIFLHRAKSDSDSHDSRLIWKWRNDPVTRQMSRHKEPIPWKQHQEWYEQTVNASDKCVLMANKRRTPLGVVRFDELKNGRWEVNINLDPAIRGQGYGRDVLSEACKYAFRLLDCSEIYAEVKPENLASIKIFELVGFKFQGMREGLRTYLLKP